MRWQAYDARVDVRMTDRTLREAENLADELGMSLAEFNRSAVHNAVRRELEAA